MALEKLIEKVKERKRVTQKALDELNTILDAIREVYDDRAEIKIGELILNHKKECSRGNVYYYDALVEKNTFTREYYEIPNDVEDIGLGHYVFNDYNCWQKFVSNKQIIYIFKNIEKWIEAKVKEEEELTGQIKEAVQSICLDENTFKLVYHHRKTCVDDSGEVEYRAEITIHKNEKVIGEAAVKIEQDTHGEIHVDIESIEWEDDVELSDYVQDLLMDYIEDFAREAYSSDSKEKTIKIKED